MHTGKSVTIGVTALTLAGALVSPDHLLVLCVGGVLAAGVWLLWPVTDAPVLLLPFGLQWMQVAVKPIQTALTGQPLNSLSDFGPPLVPAAWLAIAGIAALGLGMRLGLGRSRIDWARTLDRDASQWPAVLVIPISLAMIIGGSALGVLAHHTGGASQIVLGLAGAANAGTFILAYWCLKEGKALPVLGVVVAIEIVFGMTGFFANFRDTALVLLVAAAAARPRLSLTGLLGLAVALSVVLGAAVFWSSIKANYRDYQNGYSNQQVVVRSTSQSLHYLDQAANEFNGDRFQYGLNRLVARVSYIDFLAGAVGHVPDVIPHQNGALLGEAVGNIVKPRILFPDKPPTPNDSVITARYTGFNLNILSDTSISIGYLGDLYIDFGYYGAVIGAFLIGLFAGWAYGFIRRYRGIPLFFTYGIATMAMLTFDLFETDLVRFLGSAITTFLACLVLQRLFGPQVLEALALREARAHAS